MKLRKWLFNHHLKITEFASLVHTNRCYVHHWMSGHTQPSEKMMDRIREITMGKVDNFIDLIDRMEPKKGKK